jgi:hypothetical protein
VNCKKNDKAVFLKHNGDAADGGAFGVMLGAATKKHFGVMIKPTVLRTLITHKARTEGDVDMAMIDRTLEHTPGVSEKHYSIPDNYQQKQQALAFAKYYTRDNDGGLCRGGTLGEPSKKQTAKRMRASVKPVKRVRAPAKQAVYREDKAHCTKPGCGGDGLKPCIACNQARYCGRACQVAHWTAHKADCQRVKKAMIMMGKGR